jgi:hypothetical protein
MGGYSGIVETPSMLIDASAQLSFTDRREHFVE